MNYVLNFITVLFFAWPAQIIGYIVAAIVSGYKTGVFLYNRHEQAAINKFVHKTAPQGDKN